jgi:hypothetical protein
LIDALRGIFLSLIEGPVGPVQIIVSPFSVYNLDIQAICPFFALDQSLLGCY